jgi:rhamnosyltransferase
MTICCIIVCYRPDLARLSELCARVLADGATVILVDNTEAPYLKPDELPKGCELITLGYNSGIAHAQNAGVAHALSAGAAVLGFFDQDSKPELGMLPALLAALDPAAAEIVAPLPIDDVSGMPLPSVRLGPHGWPRSVQVEGAAHPYPVDIVISSGTVATREVFEVAGNFDEGLFIDHVDDEWCLRCRAQLIPIHVVPTVAMRHSIGSRHVKLGPLTVIVHTSTRCYYQIRNCFLLLRKPHIPFAFALAQLGSVVFSRTILLLFVKRRFSYLKSYLFAVRDGLKGVTGARPV